MTRSERLIRYAFGGSLGLAGGQALFGRWDAGIFFLLVAWVIYDYNRENWNDRNQS